MEYYSLPCSVGHLNIFVYIEIRLCTSCPNCALGHYLDITEISSRIKNPGLETCVLVLERIGKVVVLDEIGIEVEVRCGIDYLCEEDILLAVIPCLNCSISPSACSIVVVEQVYEV